MMTLSNILVMPDNDKCPTIEDVAVGLGRIPRFVGQTKRWWPVLLHSLIVYDMVADKTENKPTRLRALWHDGHEAVTEDLPTTWKTTEIKLAQDRIDKRLWAMLKMPEYLQWEYDLIHSADQAALHSEAFLVGPDELAAYFGYVGRRPIHLKYVRRVMKEYGSPVATNGPRSRAVKKFIELTHELRAK